MNLPIQKNPRKIKWLHQQILLKEELTLILLKLFKKTEEEGILPNSFYKGTITLLPERGKGTTRKIQTNITDKYRYKNYQRNISKPNSGTYRKDYIPGLSGIYLWMQEWLNICPLLFSTVLKVLARVIKLEKEIKVIQNRIVCRYYESVLVCRKSKDSTRKLLELINNFSKIAGYSNQLNFY